MVYWIERTGWKTVFETALHISWGLFLKNQSLGGTDTFVFGYVIYTHRSFWDSNQPRTTINNIEDTVK